MRNLGTTAAQRETVVRDATALKAHFGCLEKVADDARDGLIISDAASRIVLFSSGAEAMFGYAPSQALGKNISMLMTEPFKSNHEYYVRCYAATGQGQILGVGPRHLPVVHSSGRIVPSALSVSEDIWNGERFFIALFRALGAGSEKETLLTAYGELGQALADLKASYNDLNHRHRELLDRLSNSKT